MSDQSVYDKHAAVSSLVLVAQVMGVRRDPEHVKTVCATESTATCTEAELIRLARAAGLIGKVKAVPIESIHALPLPALALVGDGRWIVLAQIDNNRVLTQDPANTANDNPAIEAISVFHARYRGQMLLLKPKDIDQRFIRFGLSWFIPYIVKYKRLLLEVLTISAALQLASLTTPLFFQAVTDKVLAHRSLSTLDVIVAGLLVLSVFEVLLSFVRSYILSHTTSKIDVELGSALFRHLLALPMAYFEARKVGDSIARMRELESLREFLTGHAITLLIDVVFSIIFVAVMLYYSVTMTMIVLLSLPMYALVVFPLVPMLRERLERKFERSAANQSMLVETINGIQTVKGNSLQHRFVQFWDESLAKYVASSFRTSMLASGGHELISLISKLTSVATLWWGSREVMDGSLTIGMFIAFNMLSQRLTQPILRIAQLWNDFQQVSISIRRLAEVLDVPTENTQPTTSGRFRLKGEIEFSHVFFRYRAEGKPIIEDMTLKIRPGETVAIVGRSGSGKSTVSKLIQKMYTIDHGAILLDGHDIRTIHTDALRRQIGIVLQDNFIFARSIRDNISIAEPGASDEQIIAAARLAGAHDFITALPNGYDTIVGEHGVGLSGGQKQRIAIARALISAPRILILDEATSALDYESEAAIQSNMREICRGRTVIIIAHRLSAIRSAERIVVMDDGKISEQGSHDELIAKNGTYAKLCAMQEAVTSQLLENSMRENSSDLRGGMSQ